MANLSARTHIQNAMNHLSVVSPGGSANTSQNDLFLGFINMMLASWQAEGLNGASRTVAVSSNTQTITITSTAVSLYATLDTLNTYPIGWDDAIGFNLAMMISGSLGKVNPDRLAWVQAMASTTKAAITPGGGSPPSGNSPG